MVVPNVSSHVYDHFPGFNEKDMPCLKFLNSSHGLGPDGVPSILLQKCADVLCDPPTQIFGASFHRDTGTSVAWKEIKVVTVPKSTSE
ncbi:unnamed protein product [Trichobilharzia regenti]|nr:unnamed protein product [Trichobilharzia regenti]